MGSSSSKNRQHASSSAGAEGGAGASGVRSQITSKDKAVLDLKNARDRLKKYQPAARQRQAIIAGRQEGAWR